MYARPPIRSEASMIKYEAPSSSSFLAAERPDEPAPTIIISGLVGRGTLKRLSTSSFLILINATVPLYPMQPIGATENFQSNL